MTIGELALRTMVAADVDATIAYWQNRGVSVVMIGAQLRCHRSWAAIREQMLDIEVMFASLDPRMAA